MRDKGFAVFIAILVIAGMLMGGIGDSFAEPYYNLSGRDRVGTFGQDGKSARVGFINASCIEGATSDAFETCVYGIEPTADNRLHFPDASGILATSDGSFSGTFTGTIADTTDANIFVSNAASMESVTMSGDATIANTGALTIGANKIDYGKAFINSASVFIYSGQTSNTTTVATGTTDAMIWVVPIANISTEIVNSISVSGSTVTIQLSAAAVSGTGTTTVWRVNSFIP